MFDRIGPKFTRITETTFMDTACVVTYQQNVNAYGESVSKEVIICEDMPCAIEWKSPSVDQNGLISSQTQIGVLMYPTTVVLEAGWLVLSAKSKGQWCVVGGEEKAYMTHKECEICRVDRV